MFRPQIDKKSFFDHFEQFCLIVDETVDKGIIIESEWKDVVCRVQRKSDSAADGGQATTSTAEAATSALSGVFSFAKERIAKTILKQ